MKKKSKRYKKLIETHNEKKSLSLDDVNKKVKRNRSQTKDSV